MKRRVISMMLCALLASTTLYGCQKSNDNVDNGTGNTSEPPADSEPKDSDSKQVKTLDMFANFSWLPTDSWTGIIPDAITEETGVAFNVTRATDENQLGVMIASGELPDVIFTDTLIDRLADPDLCYSYNELIEKYGLDWKPDEERIAIAKRKNANKDDENYYTLMSYYSTQEDWEKDKNVVAPALGNLYFRKDIWKEMGSPSMNTMEDIVKVLEQVKEEYPEMIPLSGGNNAWRFTPFLQYFGGGESFLYNENGDVAYRDTTKTFKDYAAYVNSLYQKGLFPEENLAMTNEEDAKQQFVTGQCFMYEWTGRTTHLAQMDTQLKSNVAEGEVAVASIPDDVEEIQRAAAGWAGVFISKNCKDPESAIKMIEFLNGPVGRRLVVWGREGKEYTLDENDMPTFSEEWLEASKDGTTFNTKYNPNYIMTNTEIDELKSFFAGGDPEVTEALIKNSDKVKSYPELKLVIPLASTDMGIIYSKIEEARKAEVMKLYTAPDDASFKTAYEAYMKLLKDMGVDELNEYAKKEAEIIAADFK